MSFGEHVSNQKGETSTIKGLLDEIIKNIEIRLMDLYLFLQGKNKRIFFLNFNLNKKGRTRGV